MNKCSHITVFITFGLFAIACEDFVKVDPPRTDLIRSTIFKSDETATAAVIDIYYQLSGPTSFASGGVNSISFLGAVSADEAVNSFAFLTAVQAFNDNTLLPSNSWVLSLWSDLYKCIYKANAISEGLVSSQLTEGVKMQLQGETKFIRAFCHFYLVNLFGDIPLVLTTDYKVNQNISRTPVVQVYEQIVADLLEAQNLLLENYSFSKNERIRANKYAATALLSRVYLYLEQWEKAEAYATTVIDNNATYSLVPLENVFLKNSSEGILQLQPPFGNAFDRATATTYTTLHASLLNSFEEGDGRKTKWVSTNKANKYKFQNSSSSEYSVVLRLAEQYLIRAEARAKQNNPTGAKEDINIIRTRATLPDIQANDVPSILSAIEHERRVELFLEWGHRWLDLKRTARASNVLEIIKPGWQPTDALYPIPEAQLLNDPAMKDAQNPGY